MRRTALALVAMIVALGGLLVAVGGAQAAPSLERTEKQIIKLHNKARAANGVRCMLRADRCLDRFAERQARRQARRGTLAHQNLRPILRRCSVSTVGENVALGFPSAGTVNRAWMRSPGHRTNILARKFNRIGVGAFKGKDGTTYYAVVLGRR